ncbi:hypothetical protein TrVE_jg1907 [Triparma verrucosa]|uniref:non-specific serine/threonine protein kinase n=1 Tax=Triparma verrucosa TaxID=1606542 RepID=A0A9W7EW23_9STRA|nr:hypothetical protein TrVE_jg1907 [Triparma verrucosa]
MDNYDPMRVLGEGSFGKVYLMRAKKERTLVCVKVIKLKNIPRKEREACKKEVDLLRRLNHPNICGYRDSFMSRNRDSLCIVMEFCDGGDLSDIIKKARNQLFTESKILHYFVQMSLGLHYMHSNRILHRDLKTQNIFLLGNGRLVLGDLGICKVLEGTSDFAKTCIGTPYYMSPEIFKNKPYSHKADIWALGCVLYEMVTLKHAFDGSSINQLASKIIKGRFPPISSRYSAHLKDLITAMLQTNPNKRPSIERILKLPFIGRHVGDFIGDIVKRDNGGIGAGTKMVKVAALNLNDEGSQINEPKEVTSLRNQLKTLGLQNLVAKATGASPSETPSTLAAAVAAAPTSRSSKSSAPPSQSPRRPEPSSRAAAHNPALEQRKAHARAQARALNREEERKKAVEAALARLRAEREERMQKRNKIGVRGREPVKSQLPSAARGAKGMQRKRSNASNPALNKEPAAVAGMRRNPSAAAAAPGLRRQPSKYAPPAVQQQVAELENWEQRRKREEQKRKKSRDEEEASARAAAVAMQKKKQAAKPVVNIKSNLPLSKFAPGPIPQMKRPSNPSRNVRAAAQAPAKPIATSRDDDRKRQMEEFRKLKADKEILDKRIAAKLAQSKAREEEEEEKKEKEKVREEEARKVSELAKAKGRMKEKGADEAKPMLFVPAPVKIKKLPASVSASHINNVQPMLSDRGGRRSESVSALNGPPIPSKKVKPADLLADKIVGAAARGAKGVAVIEKAKEMTPKEEANGDESSDFSESDGEVDLEGSDDEFAGVSADDNETEKVLGEREAELEAELMKATMRCEDLKETLRQCKPETDDDEEEEDVEEDNEGDLLMKADGIAEEEEDEGDDSTIDDDSENDDDDDDEKPAALPPRPAKKNSEKENVMVHPAPEPQTAFTPSTPVKTPPRSNRTKSNPSAKILADLTLSKAPTPENGRGSVSARVRFLQQRCVKVLGETMYDDAYNFLKTAQEEDETDDVVQARLERILGRDRVKTFGALIDQIVFMESQI